MTLVLSSHRFHINVVLLFPEVFEENNRASTSKDRALIFFPVGWMCDLTSGHNGVPFSLHSPLPSFLSHIFSSKVQQTFSTRTLWRILPTVCVFTGVYRSVQIRPISPLKWKRNSSTHTSFLSAPVSSWARMLPKSWTQYFTFYFFHSMGILQSTMTTCDWNKTPFYWRVRDVQQCNSNPTPESTIPQTGQFFGNR